MTVLEQQLAQGLIYSRLPQFKTRELNTLRAIERNLQSCKSPYVSNSWGKQSVVMAHLVWRVNPHVLNVHWTGDDAEIIADFAATRDKFVRRFSVPYDERRRGTHLREAIHDFNATTNHDAYFVGICAYEAPGRAKTVQSAAKNNQSMLLKSGMLRFTPLAWWTQHDLAAYIAVHDLPLLSTYHRYGLEARTATGARWGSPTAKALDFLPSGRAARLRENMNKKLQKGHCYDIQNYGSP